MKLNVLIKPDPEDGGYNVSCPALLVSFPGRTIEELWPIFRKPLKVALRCSTTYNIMNPISQSIPPETSRSYGSKTD